MLVILLYVTSGHNIEEFVSAGCCILIFISNIAILFLLERMEYAASEREQLLMLNQQIQLQSKNMTSASELYSAQRKKVHDFRAHLNILNRLMKNQEYSAAEEYLEKSPNSKLIGYSLSTHIIPSWTHFSIQKLPKQLKRRSALILK